MINNNNYIVENENFYEYKIKFDNINDEKFDIEEHNM